MSGGVTTWGVEIHIPAAREIAEARRELAQARESVRWLESRLKSELERAGCVARSRVARPLFLRTDLGRAIAERDAKAGRR